MAHPRRDGLLAKVQQLSPKQDAQSDADYTAITGFALDKVIDDVANYTHIPMEELPGELDTTIVAMTLNAMAELGLLGAVSGDSGPVSSISEGDASMSFVSPLEAYTTLAGANTLTSNYLATLNTFRVVKW
ncbi:hypothetical protein PQ472_05180 [Lacticaseibacillus pabuli]|uniref:Uncharacterized protein n=1 Tax=Lacticaseibacillus pabuli TaxID=3025672 RepID=A0ABY7WWX2_9LACO|nr:hypothetical protein [Lacticaseibacillus sp. KACC 23028]WDF83630.1 hypothetical protein PQ472_05180 [Lacticaseibacillus sp. KACC 23028]